MSKQQYTWLQALSIIAWQQQQDIDDQEAPESLLQSVYARAGTFNNAPANAANDLAAALFILDLLIYQSSAKYIANLLVFALFFCKLNAAQIFPPSRAIPHRCALSRFHGLALRRCHNAHLPTSSL